MVNIATRAARAAGDIILRNMDRLESVSVSEKQRHDFVSDVDREAEKRIIQIIRQAHPDHAILAEESGSNAGTGDWQWIIDPLDGTTNFLRGFPHFAVAIAARLKDRIEHAVVFDPVRNELYRASRGGGAQLNNRRIRVSDRSKLEGAILATGFPFRHRRYLNAYFDSFRALFDRAADVRRAGSAVLDLAYVAAGRVDGFWELGLSPWDVAAGALLVTESGGVVSDFQGNETHVDSGRIVAAGPAVHRAMLEIVSTHLKTA